MLGWLIAIGVGAGWLGTHVDKLGFHPMIATTELPVPKDYLRSKASWHDAHCCPAPGHRCTEVKRTRISQDDMDKLQSRRQQDEVRARTAMHIATAEGYKMLDHWEIAHFSCCWKGDPWEKGFILAESDDMLVTWELSSDEIKRGEQFTGIRIGGISKRHCLAPPILPFGKVVMTGARSYATWPDHFHFWIEHFDAPHGRVGPRQVAVWARSEKPWRAKVNYSIELVARRLVNPMPLWYFDDEALKLARAATGLALPPRDAPTTQKALVQQVHTIMNHNAQLTTQVVALTNQVKALTTSNAELVQRLSELTTPELPGWLVQFKSTLDNRLEPAGLRSAVNQLRREFDDLDVGLTEKDVNNDPAATPVRSRPQKLISRVVANLVKALPTQQQRDLLDQAMRVGATLEDQWSYLAKKLVPETVNLTTRLNTMGYHELLTRDGVKVGINSGNLLTMTPLSDIEPLPVSEDKVRALIKDADIKLRAFVSENYVESEAGSDNDASTAYAGSPEPRQETLR